MKTNIEIKLALAACLAGMVSSALADLIPFTGTCLEPGERPFSYTYGFTYAGSDTGAAAPPPYTSHDNLAGVGFTNSTGWECTFDITALPSDPNYGGTHAYTYFGVGMDIVGLYPIAPVPVTSNLNALVFSFDARVEGLKTAQTTTKLNLNFLRFNAWDGTLTNQTPDGNADRLIGLQYNGMIVSSNWTHFEIPFNAMVIKDGSAENLGNPDYIAALNSFPVEFTTTTADDWDFDSDNALFLDNIYINSTNAPPPAPIQEAAILLQANFDDLPGAGPFAYWYCAVPVTGISAAETTAWGGGVGGSNALVITADGSGFANLGLAPAWSGFGGGINMPLSQSLTTTNLGMYRLYFNASLAGLLDTLSSAPCGVAVQFTAPDGTTGAPDGNADMILEMIDTVNVTSNYQAQSWVVNLDKCSVGGANGGSLDLFKHYYPQVNSVHVTIQNSEFYTSFQWAPGNVLALDDIKLVSLTVANPPLSISLKSGQIQLTWDSPAQGVTTLQGASSPSGPFTDIAGATSAYTAPGGSDARFFRTHWLPQ